MTVSMIICYSLLVISLFIALISSICMIFYRQKDWTKRFKELDDMQKCPKTSAYFMRFQSSFELWHFAFAAGSLFGILMYFLLIVNNVFTTNIITGDRIISIVLFSTLTVSLGVYKLLNCLLSRMCGRDSCSTPYFKSN